MKQILWKTTNQTLKYIIKLLFIAGAFSITSVSRASIKNVLPTGIQVSFDLPRPFYYLWKEKTGGQYEINTSINFNKILVDGDYGWGTILRKNPPKKIAAMSENIGQYFRIGFSYNFITNSVDHNAAFLGIRYSKAYFKDYLYGKLAEDNQGKVSLKNPTPATDGNKWQQVRFQKKERVIDIDQNKELQAQWFEIVAGVRVKIWEWIYTGCTARYKFAKKVSNTVSQTPFDIIGWGINEDDAFGVNFYIGIRIPLQSNTITNN